MGIVGDCYVTLHAEIVVSNNLYFLPTLYDLAIDLSQQPLLSLQVFDEIITAATY